MYEFDPPGPHIVDDAHDSPETATLKYEARAEGGLQDRLGSISQFISMSAYGKPPSFDIGRSYSTESTYAYGTASQQPTQPPLGPPQYQNAPQVAHMSYDNHVGNYGTQCTSTTDNKHLFHIYPVNALKGSTGQYFDIRVSTQYNITSLFGAISVMFGRKKVPGMLKLDAERPNEYIVSAEIPQVTETGCSSPVPIYLLIDDENGPLGRLEYNMGQFEYVEAYISGVMENQPSYGAPKRSYSGDDDNNRLSKRTALPSSRVSDRGTYPSFSNVLDNSSSWQQMGNTYNTTPLPSAPYSRRSSIFSSMNNGMGYRNDMLSGYQSNPPLTQSHYSSTIASAPRSAYPPQSAEPLLVRTATLDGSRPLAGAQTPAFYHQQIHALPATLHINGELNSVADLQTWSQDELKIGRRLVHFKRNITNNRINLSFKVIKPEERQPNQLTISCILWERREWNEAEQRHRTKRSCYVTSVDTISILDHILTQRQNHKFPTEEKNRIRRNLEHYKPLTVKKPDPNQPHEGLDALYTVIMGFPQPKPRNIEKDIKVFEWWHLHQALNRITHKYSIIPPPQQSSALLTPASSSGYATEHNPLAYTNSTERNGMWSPRPSRSLSSLPTPQGGPSSYVPGPPRILSSPTKHDPSYPQRFPNDHRSQFATYGDSSANWSQAHQIPAPQPTPRPSFDFNSYIDHTQTGPSSATSAGQYAQQYAPPQSYARQYSGNVTQQDLSGESLAKIE